MTLYERFRQLNIDFSQIGLETGGTDTRCFCTPQGAEIIGWAGVDGIHYCFIEGFGEMVFAVNPMNLPGEYVHPLAGSFEAFLRLLLACNSLDVMEQAYRMDRAAFDCEVWEGGFLEDGQIQAREAIQNGLSLTPMPEPYDYIKTLQAEFDYSSIPYTEEYTPFGPDERLPDPEWEVYYNGGFWEPHEGHGRPGQEIPVKRDFTWGGNVWHIPAVYSCEEGLVVDFCIEVEPERFRAFQDKWHLYADEDAARRSEEEREQMEQENPLYISFRAEIEMNGTTIRQTDGRGYSFLPLSCIPDNVRSDYEIRQHKPLMTHYRLDPSMGWVIHRVSIPWDTKNRPEFKSFTLHLEQDPVHFPGPRITAPEAGESLSFTHPVTGMEHTLTVLEYEHGEMNPEFFNDKEMEYPLHYIGMSYEISPDIPRDRISIQDCGQGDSPRPKKPQPGVLSSSFGMIFMAVPRGEPRAAVSSLHFEPVDDVEWRMTFHEKTLDGIDIEISLNEL